MSSINNTFINVPMTVDQADQAVYAIEQCQRALIRALNDQTVPASTKRQSSDVLDTYAGAIDALRVTLESVDCPADPPTKDDSIVEEKRLFHEMLKDQPMWKRWYLACTPSFSLVDANGNIIAVGKKHGTTFYEGGVS